MNQDIKMSAKDKAMDDFSKLDKTLNDMRDISETYNEYAARFQNLLDAKELDEEQRQEMIKELIYNTEYLLYRLKANLKNSI